jgi:hypothetical protein
MKKVLKIILLSICLKTYCMENEEDNNKKLSLLNNLNEEKIINSAISGFVIGIIATNKIPDKIQNSNLKNLWTPGLTSLSIVTAITMSILSQKKELEDNDIINNFIKEKNIEQAEKLSQYSKKKELELDDFKNEIKIQNQKKKLNLLLIINQENIDIINIFLSKNRIKNIFNSIFNKFKKNYNPDSINEESYELYNILKDNNKKFILNKPENIKSELYELYKDFKYIDEEDIINLAMFYLSNKIIINKELFLI